MVKKPSLDKDQLSKFSVLSKIIERVVKSHVLDHLTSNKLLFANLLTVIIIAPKWLSYILDHLIN